MPAARAVAFFDTLTCDSCFKALATDDSVISRNRSRQVEFLAFIFDHVTDKNVKGFDLLIIGWTDGYSFISVAFNMRLQCMLPDNATCAVRKVENLIVSQYKTASFCGQ